MQAAQRELQRNQLALCEVPWDQIEAAQQELQQNPAALYNAAWDGDLQKIRLLLAADADINSCDTTSDYTPLHIAAFKGHKEVVTLLLQHPNADSNIRTRINKATPLHHAVAQGNEEIARFLLEHKADVNARNKDGNTPLHIAASWEREEMIQLLLKYGADITAQEKLFGKTPLHNANNLQVLKFLVSGQVEVPQNFEKARVSVLHHVLSIQDNGGKTVRDRAIEKDKQDIVDFVDSVLKSARA